MLEHLNDYSKISIAGLIALIALDENLIGKLNGFNHYCSKVECSNYELLEEKPLDKD